MRHSAGWAKIKAASQYAGVSSRTLRGWLKSGLHHSRLPSGTVLIRLEDIDSFLKQFAADPQQVERAVDEIMREFSTAERVRP